MIKENSHYIRKFVPFVPSSVKEFIRKRIDTIDYFRNVWAQDDPFINEHEIWKHPGSSLQVGIIKEFTHRHSYYVSACREMGLSYQLFDLSHPDWVSHFRNSSCDFFVVWPSTFLGIWKEMFDERLWILENHLNKVVYPGFNETFIFENKRRVHDWLDVHNIPHPKTWTFFEKHEALNFASKCPIPIVIKTVRGSCASGVFIVRSRNDLLKITKRFFSNGILPDRGYKWDAQRLSIFFQEYLEDVEEWRMVRIGNSYFGYRKEKTGEYHSGSHGWTWLDPGPEMLNFLLDVTERSAFTSMNVDVFRTKNGRLLVNELQTMFGATNPADMLVVDGVCGRYTHNKLMDQWLFEAGNFCRNHLANLRIQYVIDYLINQVGISND